MIFFTMFITLIRRRPEGSERRLGSPARREGNTILLPIGTDVEVGDYVEYVLLNDEPQVMAVIDVVHPHIPGANTLDDHIEVTCVPEDRMTVPAVTAPVLHPSISVARELAADGRLSDAVFEALRLVEERVQSLDITTTTGHEAGTPGHGAGTSGHGAGTSGHGAGTSGHGAGTSGHGAGTSGHEAGTSGHEAGTTGHEVVDECEGFRHLFTGAMVALRNPLGTGQAAYAAVDETLERLAVASMLMRWLDRAEGRAC